MAEYADNYRDISYHDNLALLYCIDSQYCVFKIIVLYQMLMIHFEDYRFLSNFDNLIWNLSHHIECWSFVLKNIVSNQILYFVFEVIVSNLIIKVWNYRYRIEIKCYLLAIPVWQCSNLTFLLIVCPGGKCVYVSVYWYFLQSIKFCFWVFS